MVHEPDIFTRVPERVALTFAGHTHGGQICLPGGQPVFTQLVRCRHGASGVWRQGDMVGYTSPGLGVSQPGVGELFDAEIHARIGPERVKRKPVRHDGRDDERGPPRRH